MGLRCGTRDWTERLQIAQRDRGSDVGRAQGPQAGDAARWNRPLEREESAAIPPPGSCCGVQQISRGLFAIGGTWHATARMNGVAMDGTPRKFRPNASGPPVPPAASLPNDPAPLKAMIATLMHERETHKQRADNLELVKLRLEIELLRYKKWVYGPRADRLATLAR